VIVGTRGPWILVGIMAVAVVALLAALLLRGDDGPGADELLAAAPGAVDAQGTAGLRMTVDLGGDALDVGVEATGGVDFESGAGHLLLTLLGQQIELRTDGRTLFVLPDGEDQWLATKADEEGALDALGGTGPNQAVELVDLLRGDLDDVEDLGEVDIGGEPTRHLRFTVAAEGEVVEALAGDGEDVPIEVWIDERNLPVRQRIEGNVQGVDVVVTIDLTDWGRPLAVTIPPEGEVRDVEPEELAQIFGAPVPG